MLDPLDDQLSDAITPVNLVTLLRVGVDQQHLDFASITRVDQARGVQAGHTVLEGEAASRLDEAGIPFGQSHLDPGWHQSSTASRSEDVTLCRHKVAAPIGRVGIGRDTKPLLHHLDRHITHGPRVPPPLALWARRLGYARQRARLDGS